MKHMLLALLGLTISFYLLLGYRFLWVLLSVWLVEWYWVRNVPAFYVKPQVSADMSDSIKQNRLIHCYYFYRDSFPQQSISWVRSLNDCWAHWYSWIGVHTNTHKQQRLLSKSSKRGLFIAHCYCLHLSCLYTSLPHMLLLHLIASSRWKIPAARRPLPWPFQKPWKYNEGSVLVPYY